jgi:predicted O-methyltransferase YrrM
MDPGISPVPYASGATLYELVRNGRMDHTLEVGLGFGLSAQFICQAHQDKGSGTHIVIDPFQDVHYDGIGWLNIQRLGFEDMVTFVPEPSHAALPMLVGKGTQLDFAFIDGRHLFDYALLDFFFIDKMLRVGGIVVFDDIWSPGIRKVVAFVLRNYAYHRVSRPSEHHSSSGRRARRIARRLAQRPFLEHLSLKLIGENIVVLKKDAEDSRDDSYVPF